MEKKTIMLELTSELIDKIDRINTMGDRSEFIQHLLNQQIEKPNEKQTNDSNSQITRIID